MIAKNLNCKTIAAIEKIDSIINKHKEAIELKNRLIPEKSRPQALKLDKNS